MTGTAPVSSGLDIMTAPMRVLTLRPPWAEAVTFGDDQTGKRTENRRARTHYRGLIAVHSGRAPDWDAPPQAWAAGRLAPPWAVATRKRWIELFVTGAVISVAELAGCHSHRDCPGGLCSPWAITSPGTWHWELANIRPLPEPVLWTGRLGLRPISGDVGAAVRAQLAGLP
jgi:hypothetical protein